MWKGQEYAGDVAIKLRDKKYVIWHKVNSNAFQRQHSGGGRSRFLAPWKASELECLDHCALVRDIVRTLPLCPALQSFPGGLCPADRVSVARPCLSVVVKGRVPLLSRVQVQEPAVCIPGQEPLTASMLAAAPLHEQKQMIGEWLQPEAGAERGPAWWGETLRGGQTCGRGPALLWTDLLGSPLLSRPPSLS